MKFLLFPLCVCAGSAAAQEGMPILHFQADNPIVWEQNGQRFGGQLTGQIQLELFDEGTADLGTSWPELLAQEHDPLRNFTVDRWQDYQFQDNGGIRYSFEPYNLDLGQAWERNQIQPNDLNNFLVENPTITLQLNIPLADLGPYGSLLSATDNYEVPDIISDFDLSKFGLSEEQESELQRILSVTIAFAGLAEVDVDNCEACAGVGVAPGGPVIIPPIPGVAGVPTLNDYRGFVGDLVSDPITLGVVSGDASSGLYRRMTLLKMAVAELTESAEDRRIKPRISFIENVSDGFWSSTSIAVVVESEVLDPMDRGSLVGFQITLREQDASDFVPESNRGTALIVDSYVRRTRANFILGRVAPELDEDFERMLHDISGSNRREQELANQLLGYLTEL